MSIDRSALARVKLTPEDAVRRMPVEFIDTAMFTADEDKSQLRWTLPCDLIEVGLIPFLRAQYALFGHRAPKDSEATLSAIAEAGTCDRILALAEMRSLVDFQMSTMGEINSIGLSSRVLPVRANVLVYQLEGKVLSEGLECLFTYVESLVRLQRKEFPIAGAVKVFLE